MTTNSDSSLDTSVITSYPSDPQRCQKIARRTTQLSERVAILAEQLSLDHEPWGYTEKLLHFGKDHERE